MLELNKKGHFGIKIGTYKAGILLLLSSKVPEDFRQFLDSPATASHQLGS